MDETGGSHEISLFPIQPIQDIPIDAEPEKELGKVDTGKEISTQTDLEITMPKILTTEIGVQTVVVIETRGIPIREIGIQTEEKEKSEKSPEKEEKRRGIPIKEIGIQTEGEEKSEKSLEKEKKREIKNRKIQRDRGLHNMVK